jgi:hypothetical protein
VSNEDKPKTPPIEPQEFVRGVKVVDIGDLRVARGMSRRPHSACRHLNLVYDDQERRIWCKDCETDVEAFDAFVSLVKNYNSALKDIHARKEALDTAEKFAARSLAGKALDEAWRSRSMVPACPHCGNGLFPESFRKGFSMLGREFALARLGKKDGKP